MKLTARQYKLYEYLKENYEEGVYISKQKICNDLSEFYKINEKETRVCRALEEDVRKINDDDTLTKIIVSNKNGYKIGSKVEVQKYIKKRMLRDVKSINLTKKIARKYKLDRQMQMVWNSEKPMVETFIEKGVK